MNHRERIEQLREAGETDQAIFVASAAFPYLIRMRHYPEAIHVLIEMFHCYTHKYELEDDPLVLKAREELAESIRILCNQYGVSEKLYIANFLLAKVEAEKNNYASAIGYIDIALKNFRGNEAEKADWLAERNTYVNHLKKSLGKNK